MPSDTGRQRTAPPPLITVSGALVSYVHTIFGFLAFGGALLVALSLHYHKVVKNGVAGWPHEYWPSVSATIGDWYPERNLFQIGIALMSGPRFVLVLLSSMLVSLSKPSSVHARTLLAVGILRTLACGGWVYVTSTDDHDVHDIMMGAYLVLTPPWMFITSGSLAVPSVKHDSISTSPANRDVLAAKARKMRRIAAACFFGMIPFMVLFFYRHKVLQIPGAYTHYAFFEWGLIVFDLLFDCASMYDLSRIEIQIVEASAPTVGAVAAPSLLGGAWLRGGAHEAVASGAWSTAPSSSSTTKRGQKRNAAVKEEGDTIVRVLVDHWAECYVAFLFWTSLTGLHPQIFFFSVYNMGVGGHEALLVVQVIALGLALLPPVHAWLTGGASTRLTKATSTDAHVGRPRLVVTATLYALCMAGFTVWRVESAFYRLVATSLSCVGFSVLTALEWGRAWETDEVHGKAVVWLTGLLLSSLAKYANHGNNPAWAFLHAANGGHNFTAITMAAKAVSVRLYSIRRQNKTKLEPYKPRKAVDAYVRATAVLSLGALLYGLHVLLSDSGTLIAWTWTGYPLSGPMAIPHARWVLLASCASTVAAVYRPGLSLHYIWWAGAAVSVSLVYTFEDWTGFLGALGVAATLPPTALPLIQLAMQDHPLRTMFFVWLVADLLAFFQVLTAAYAFVPGGQIMRERTGLLMAIMTLFLLAGLWTARKQYITEVVSTRARSRRLVSCVVLLAIAVAAQVVPLFRTVAPTAIVPHYPEDRVLTAGIWTVHFSLDQDMWDSTRRMSSLIADLKLDVVGLLETDLHRTVFGNRDLTQYLAESLGMYADMGPGPDKHTWGAALLSKFPIINSTHHLLPSPNGELAPAIHAVLDVFGVATHVVVSHNGQEEDPLDRELQTTKLASILSEAYPHPAIFLGYVVTRPHAPRPNPYQILFEDGRIHDVMPSDQDRWCEYIGFRALERVAYVRVSRYTVTDTELQTAKFRVPMPDAAPIDPSRDTTPHSTMKHPGEHVRWTYPKQFIDPPSLVYARHKYSPWYYPWYFYAEPAEQLQL